MKNMPNILTILRLVACPILIYLFFFGTYLTILIVFMLACLTDFFDGYLARKESLKTNLGKILDPIMNFFIFSFGKIVNLISLSSNSDKNLMSSNSKSVV